MSLQGSAPQALLSHPPPSRSPALALALARLHTWPIHSESPAPPSPLVQIPPSTLHNAQILTSGAPTMSSKVPRTAMSQRQTEPGCFCQSIQRSRDLRDSGLRDRTPSEKTAATVENHLGACWGYAWLSQTPLFSHGILTPGLKQGSSESYGPQIQYQRVLEGPKLGLNSLEPSFPPSCHHSPLLSAWDG